MKMTTSWRPLAGLLLVAAFAAAPAAGPASAAQSGRRRNDPPPATQVPTFTSDDVPSGAEPASPAPSDAVTAARAAGPIAWQRSFDAARSAATSEQIVFVDVYTDWCGYCKMMDRQIFTHASVRRFAADHVFVKVNAEDGGEGTAFARKAGVRGFPTLLVYSSDGKLLGRNVGAFRNPGAFLDWLVAAARRR